MIREATEADIPRIMELVKSAKAIMRSDGNMTQWADSYPDEAKILQDIKIGAGRIVLQDSAEPRSAYFAIIPSPEPTYASIEGQWLDDSLPYHVIHRIASGPESHGIFREIIDYALSVDRNLRIDTHSDNRIMQNVITKAGFSYCGVILLADGAPRLAYQILKQ